MKKYKFSFLALSLLVLLFSCQTEGLNGSENGKNDANIKTFLISMPKQSIVRTDDSDKSKAPIDFSTLKIFMFEANGGKFIKTFTPTMADIEYDDQKGGYRVPFDFTDVQDKKESDLVFIANADEIKDPEKDEAESDYCQKLILDLKGKASKMPFWGELKNFQPKSYPNGFDGTIYGNDIKVPLIRSLAQISFHVEKSAQSYIKLQDIYVYNTLNKAKIIPDQKNFDKTDNKVTAPTLPDGAEINGDSTNVKFLSYLKSDGIKDSAAIDLIYIPEQKSDKDSIFLILAGKYGTSNDISYYRIDLKNKNNKGKAFDILRNHNYIINIKKVLGPGYKEIENAVNSGPSNIDVDIVEWDSSISVGYLWGNKNFGVNTSDIMFGSKKDLTEEIKYQTNLSNEEITKEIKYSLDDEGQKHFIVSIDTSKNALIVKTKEENNGSQDFKGMLTITRDGLSTPFIVNITQATPDLEYFINCDSTKINGIYVQNLKLNEDNFLKVYVYSKIDLTGRQYEIKTNRIDGISFGSKGTFPKFEQTESKKSYYCWIDVPGQGTPLSNDPKNLLISYNSISLANCNAEVKMTYSPKKILGVSSEQAGNPPYPVEDAGFAMQGGLSKLFRENINNFGQTKNSVVKIQGIEYKFLSFGDYYELRYHKERAQTYEQSLKEEIEKKPDIIVWGYPAIITVEAGKILADYVKKGGCLILMTDNVKSIRYFFNSLYGKDLKIGYNEIEMKDNEGAGVHRGLCFSFKNLPYDPVLKGPFGRVNERSWGEDGPYVKALTNFPEEDIITYSNSVPTGTEKRYISEDILYVDRGITIFRHTKYNVILISDASFIAGKQDAIAYIHKTRYPFAINVKPIINSKDPMYNNTPAFRPIMKQGYGGDQTPNNAVCNSIFFGNALAYMIDRAEFHGINSKQ